VHLALSLKTIFWQFLLSLRLYSLKAVHF